MKERINHFQMVQLNDKELYREVWDLLTESQKRNKPCICGSGKKYKNCCINKKDGE